MNLKKFLIYILSFFILINIFLPFVNCYATDTNNVTIDAPVAILMEASTGKVIYEKNAYEKMNPASTTKIMTAILALENRELSHVCKVSYNAISTVPATYTIANLQLDEEVTIEQLLYTLLIPSANDSANVIAEDIGGSVESFASMMNTKANEIGCKNTHFVNANGVHDDNHYSTAYDLALIGRYAMRNETFRKIVSTVRYALPTTNKYDKTDRVFNTTNYLINNKSKLFYKYATGVKTGYTDNAKNCIVSSAKKDDMELICVVLGADNTSESNKFLDSKTLFEYGFNNYCFKTIHIKDNVYKVISPSNANKDNKDLNVLFENDLRIFVKRSDKDTNFVPEVNLNNKIKAPISKGSVIGNISYNIDGINYTTNLVAGQDIEANSTSSIVIKIVVIIFALIIFKTIINTFSHGKRYKKKRKKKKSKKPNYYEFKNY